MYRIRHYIDALYTDLMNETFIEIYTTENILII